MNHSCPRFAFLPLLLVGFLSPLAAQGPSAEIVPFATGRMPSLEVWGVTQPGRSEIRTEGAHILVRQVGPEPNVSLTAPSPEPNETFMLSFDLRLLAAERVEGVCGVSFARPEGNFYWYIQIDASGSVSLWTQQADWAPRVTSGGVKRGSWYHFEVLNRPGSVDAQVVDATDGTPVLVAFDIPHADGSPGTIGWGAGGISDPKAENAFELSQVELSPVDTSAAPPVPAPSWRVTGQDRILGGNFVPPTISESVNALALTWDIKKLRFSRRTLNIERATVLGTSLGTRAFPDFTLTDASGQTYSQNRATQGRLSWSDEGEWLRIEGTFLPGDEEGRNGPPVAVLYEVRKRDGIIRVTYSLPEGARTVRQVAVDHAFNLLDENGLDKLMTVEENSGPDVFGWYGAYHPCPPDRDGRHTGDWVTAGAYHSGKIGCQFQPLTYEGSRYSEGLERHFCFYTANRVHHATYYFVNVAQAEGVDLRPGTSLTYILAFLPYRKFRPLNLFMGANPGSGYDPVTPALIGETVILGPPGGGVGGRILPWWDPAGDRQFIHNAHRLGLAVMKHIDFMWMHVPNVVEAGLYTGEQAANDRMICQAWGKTGIPPWQWPTPPGAELPGGGRDPEGFFSWRLALMCPNAPHWNEYLKDCIARFFTEKEYDLDGFYLDSNEDASCRNTKHGCSADYSYTAIGQLDLLSFIRDLLDERERAVGRPMLIDCHVHDKYAAAGGSLGDFFNPGEEMGAEFPSPLKQDLAYSSLPSGIQVSYYTGAALAQLAGQKKLFTKALARCATVWVTPEAVELWHRYMLPLRIFDAANSSLHHPIDPDFGSYLERGDLPEGVTPVLYCQPGRTLLVIANEGVATGKVDLRIKKANPAQPGETLLAYDVTDPGVADLRIGHREGPVRRPAPPAVSAAKVAADGTALLSLSLPDRDDSRILLLLPEPKDPALIWNDHLTWAARQTWDGSSLVIHYSGIPLARAQSLWRIYTAGRGEPRLVSGARQVEYDRASGILTLEVEHSLAGCGSVQITFR